MAVSATANNSNVHRTRIGLMTYLVPKGELTGKDVLEALRSEVSVCIAQWETRVVIDLSSVRTLNSVALEELVSFYERLLKLGGWLKVMHVNSLIKDIFYLTGLDEIIPIMRADNTDLQLPNRSKGKRARIGDVLVSKGLISESQLQEALELQKEVGKHIGQVLIGKGCISESDMQQTLAEQLGIPYIKLCNGLFDTELNSLLAVDVVRRLKMLPLFRIAGVLYLATSDPQAIPSFNEIEERTKLRVQPILAGKENIVENINEAYSGGNLGSDFLGEVDGDFEVIEEGLGDDYSAIDEMAEGSPVVNLVNSLIQRAVHDRASDIHIEPAQKKSRIRFRIDGLLYEVMNPKLELHPSIVSRLKVMANLDIAERRMPQDGRIQVHTQGRSVDLRFSSLPGLYGEKIVLRVLDKNQSILDVDKLGMAEDNLNLFKSLLSSSHGLILVTGPTGSGKTTSLYAAINYLNSMEKNIVTIEDPVEYQVDVINQNEVKESINLTFAKMLKHVLRQDPDIVMIGEIREKETAEIAVQAALTGHLVLSTLHTNDSVGAITRMIDMGVEPYLLSSALIGVVAQRLVRGICSSCKTAYIASPDLKEKFGWDREGKVRLAKGKGCLECYDSGYKGRLGIHEVIKADTQLQQLVMTNPSRDQLAEYLKEHKIKQLFDDGMERVIQCKTSIEEVSRVINS
ncbi:MAG: Flp pilus assembly complex ATPase component TadA [Kangiellaceae bacterium]|nr:Flp pilus assembly complex ATPase component TadA [Kangiellaceae bacterium]